MAKNHINPQTEFSADSHAADIIEKAQVANRLRISQRTVDIWMKEKRIPYLKIGRTVRFRWSDVLEHLKRYEQLG